MCTRSLAVIRHLVQCSDVGVGDDGVSGGRSSSSSYRRRSLTVILHLVDRIKSIYKKTHQLFETSLSPSPALVAGIAV
jgi:hypothetical protein